MNLLAGYVEHQAYTALGRKIYLIFFGWLGTMVHEFGHALLCVIFGHRLIEVRLFDPNPDTGTLGYVNHTYNPSNIYHVVGNFFIGIGPILLGSLVIYLLCIFLLGIDVPKISVDYTAINTDLNYRIVIMTQLQNIWGFVTEILKSIFTWGQLSRWQFYLFIYLAFCIGSSMTLSRADIKGTARGFIALTITWFLFNFITIWVDAGITYYVFTNLFMFIAVFYAVLFIILIIVAVASISILGISLLGNKAIEQINE